YSPMTVRFFILQTHYRSTLDFSNEALKAAEKGLNRLWNAYEVLQDLDELKENEGGDKKLNEKIWNGCEECTDFMNDDFNTAKVLANLFDMVPVINSIHDGKI